MDLHRRAELRSLAYHRAIASRLASSPEVLARARVRVATWLDAGSTHPHYATLWSQVLSRPLDQLAAALVDEGETMTAARQSSPFAGALSPHERWSLWRHTGANP